MDYPLRRRQRLARLLKDEQLDAFLVTHPVNVTYLTGFSGDSSAFLVGRKQSVLISDGRFTPQIAEECPGLDVYIRPIAQKLPEAIAHVVNRFGVNGIGFESGHVTVGMRDLLGELAPGISWSSKAEAVEKLRVVKDPSEVVQLREAISIAERAFTMFQAMLRPEDNEKDLCDHLEMYIRRAGGTCSSFPSIVAVGERAALAHAPPTRRTVGEADLLLIDWGASGRFYKSDLTRVLATRRISAKLEKVYAVVLRAQERALQAIRPGVKASAIDAEARSVIDAAGFGRFFIHGLGHGLGLQVHEAPAVRPDSKDVLQAGMVVTIEPGIYLPGWGGVRLEDDVLVTPDGCEVLTSVTKDLKAIFEG